MNQRRFCFIKIRRSSREWKEIGTSASLAGHCYNADDRIIKVITSLRMACGVNVFIVRLEHAILYPECINTKTSTASCMRREQNHFIVLLLERALHTAVV